jgi:3-oxoadipate enol-lactonase
MPLYARRSAGAPDTAAAVVFVHGFPFDGSLWDPQLAAMPSGWRGLAPDLRGFGRSPLDAEGTDLPTGAATGAGVALREEPVLTMDRLADDVAAFIETESTPPAVVCGLSMGGYVLFALARRRPDLLRAVVLADTRAEADSDAGRENRRRLAQVVRTAGPTAVAREMLPALLAERTLQERPAVVDHVRAMMEGTPAETLIAALAGMAGRRDATADLAAVTVPALVVVGEHDTLTPADAARALAARLPDARLEVVPDAGHVSNLENPGAFNRVLSDFLASA